MIAVRLSERIPQPRSVFSRLRGVRGGLTHTHKRDSRGDQRNMKMPL